MFDEQIPEQQSVPTAQGAPVPPQVGGRVVVVVIWQLLAEQLRGGQQSVSVTHAPPCGLHAGAVVVVVVEEGVLVVELVVDDVLDEDVLVV